MGGVEVSFVEVDVWVAEGGEGDARGSGGVGSGGRVEGGDEGGGGGEG